MRALEILAVAPSEKLTPWEFEKGGRAPGSGFRISLPDNAAREGSCADGPLIFFLPKSFSVEHGSTRRVDLIPRLPTQYMLIHMILHMT